MRRSIFCVAARGRTPVHADEDPDMMIDPVTPAEDRLAAAASLRTFMRLPAAQRIEHHPDGRARLFARRDRRCHRREHCRRESRAASRPHAPARAGAASRTMPAAGAWPKPSARCSPPMSTASTRAISTPCATCWPTRYGSISSTRAGSAAAARSHAISPTIPGSHDWHLAPGLVDRRPALLVRDPADPRASRPTSSCSAGQESASRRSAISATHAMWWRMRS